MRSHRIGYTLIETVVSLVSASILIAGLATSLSIALKANDPTTFRATSGQTSNAFFNLLLAEIQHAESVSVSNTNTLLATVKDRNGDSVADTISYAWSGTPGDAITRSFNGAAAVPVVESVNLFNIAIHSRPDGGTSVDVIVQVGTVPATRAYAGVQLVNIEGA